MKRFWVPFGLFCAVFFASCDGEKDFNADNGSSNQNSSETSACSYGTYKCYGNDSYFCGYPDSNNDLMWLFAEKCNDGCNEQTGKCNADSDAGNNGGSGNNESGGNNGNDNNDNSSENNGGSGNNNNNNNDNGSENNDDQAIPCTRDENYYGTKKCIDGHSYSCECASYDQTENGAGEQACNKYLWVRNKNICKGGCDESTGQCKKAECSIEQADAEIYECFEDCSFKCEKDDSSNASWRQKELCDLTGCNKSTGRCNLCEENSFICYKSSNFNYSNSYKCEDGHFKYYGDCDENESGCDSSSGKCRCTDFVEGYKSCYYGSELRTCINGLWEIEKCDYDCVNETLSCADPCEQGTFRCNGDMLQKCDQGVWKNYENCSGKTCNKALGICE